MSLFSRLAKKHKGTSAPQLDVQIKQTPILTRHNSDKVISPRKSQHQPQQRKISAYNLNDVKLNNSPPVYIFESTEVPAKQEQLEHQEHQEQRESKQLCLRANTDIQFKCQPKKPDFIPNIYLLRSPVDIIYIAVKNKLAGVNTFTRISIDFVANRILYVDGFWKISHISYDVFQQLYDTSILPIIGTSVVPELVHVVSSVDCYIILSGQYEGTIISCMPQLVL
jgi:hypothetical protein